MRWPGRLGLCAGAYLTVFTVLASLILLYATGLDTAFRYDSLLENPVWQWFAYWACCRSDPVVYPWLLISGIPAALLPLLVVGGAVLYRWRRSPRMFRPAMPSGEVRQAERGPTDNHGHTRWRSFEDARKLFPGPHPTWGGIAVGEAYRVDHDRSVAGMPFDPHDRKTWGMGGKAALLVDPCTEGSGHSLVFAGSGAFKSVSACAAVLTWVGSSVILDPSTELGPMLDGALRCQGKLVAHIGIATDTDDDRPGMVGVNVLAWLDITHPEAELHLRSVVSWIYEEAPTARSGRPEDPFFAPMGRALVTCLLAHLVWSDPSTVDITLETFAAAFAVSETEMLKMLGGIRTSSHSPMARRIAATLMQCQAEETFSGVFLNAINGIQWLFTDAYARLVSVDDFDLTSLLREPATVFLNIGQRTLETTPAIARVLVGALLNTVYMADGNTRGKVLFLLDEAAQLGRLKALETARDTGRKYGVVLHMLWQSIGQMADIWGHEGTRSWIDAAHWIGYAAIRAGGAGKDLSDQLGAHGVLAWSEGDNQGRQKPFGINFGSVSRGSSVNIHEIRRALITGPELQQNLRDDEFIVVPASGMPIRCGRPLWFRREEMRIAIGVNNRFVSEKEIVNG